MERASGILLPIFSLPGRYGIGSLGREARDFADFLKAAGQKWWQVLPVGPVGSGNSPYASPSTFAGDPLYIDLEQLTEEGLLTEAELRLVEAELRLLELLTEAELRLLELLPLERVLVLVWVEVPRLRVCASAAGLASIVQANKAEVKIADSFIMCRFLLSPR